MAKSWEDRYIDALASPEFGALGDFAKGASARARQLGEDDLAEEISDQAREVQKTLDDLQDLMNELDELEKGE